LEWVDYPFHLGIHPDAVGSADDDEFSSRSCLGCAVGKKINAATNPSFHCSI
jgi:hypothetical protein